MKGSKQRVSTSGSGESFGSNPFGELAISGLPEGPKGRAKPTPRPAVAANRKGATLGLRRETSGRAGKAVVTITPIDPMAPQVLEELGKKLRQKLGTGGTCKGKVVEIQGDRLPEIRELLEAAGYRCRQTGG